LEFYQMTPCTTILVPRELQRREAEVRPPAACAGRLSRRDSLRFSPARPPRRRCAAPQRDRLAALHSITLSVRESSDLLFAARIISAWIASYSAIHACCISGVNAGPNCCWRLHISASPTQ